jgi:mono/diheme cytochrome c family protein
MMSVRFALFIVATLLIAVACNQPSTDTTNQKPSSVATPALPSSTPDEFASARATFNKECTVCHGADGSGGRKQVEGQTLKVPSFREGHALKHKYEDFVRQIENGGDGMPKFKAKLSPEQIRDMVRFVRHEFQGK